MANTFKFGNGNWAVKKGSVLAYNNENNNFKPLPFDFTRNTIGTYVDSDGLIKTASNNEARIDYLDNADGHLLLEPSRRNNIQRAEEFDNGYWGKSNGTATANQTISPDGSQNADRFAENTSTASHLISRSGISISSGVSYTLSVFAKANGRNTFRLFKDDSSQAFAFFNLNSGSIGTTYGVTAKMVNYGNGWYRCSITFTSASTSTYIQFLLSQDNETHNYLGDGSSGMYFWGAQLEQGSYPTSYIPTNGETNGVTRATDSCNQTPASGIIGQTELTLFYKGIVERLGGNDGHAIALSQSADAAGSARILLYRNSSNGNMYVYVQDTSTVFSTPLLVNSNPQINDKYAIAIKDNDLVVYCNGVKVAENNTGTIPQTQYIYINEWNYSNYHKNITQEVKLYNTRLTDAELATLTT